MGGPTSLRRVLVTGIVAGLCFAGAPAEARVKPRPMPTMGGVVWTDADGDGVRDRGEAVVRSVKVTVERMTRRRGKSVASRVASKTTGAKGTWSFRPKRAGRYRARVARPSSYRAFTAANRGAKESVDSDVVAKTGTTPTVRLARGGKARRFDAGLLLRKVTAPPTATPTPLAPSGPPAPPPAGPPFQIGGVIWRDTNGDGIRQSNEPIRFEGTVELWTADKTQRLAQTTANSFGSWTLTVPGGVAYRVRVIVTDNRFTTFAPKYQGTDRTLDSDINWAGPHKGYTDVIPAGTGSMSFDTAAREPVSLGNFVWRDTDLNGLQDTNEVGVGGVTVQLWDAARTELLDATTTAANGSYRLIAPTGGQTYRVRVAPPPGAGFTIKDAGGNDALDSDFFPSGPDLGWTDPLVIPSNQIERTNVDAGLVAAP